MKRVWHIALKDLRRMAPPVALWLAFIAATAVWFRLASPGSRDGPVPGIIGWLPMMGIWTRLLVAGQLVIGYLLAGALVVEDAVVGEENFWMTRPIGNARLLGAKVLAAVVLFILGPVVALATVWLASGFGLREVWLAGCETALRQGLVTLPALAAASLSRNLVQFLFCSVGLCIGYLVCSAYGVTASFFPAQQISLRHSRDILVQWGLAPAVVLVLLHQFLTQRTGRSWVIIGAMLAGCFAIRVAWPIELSSVLTTSGVQKGDEDPAYRDVSMTVERTSLHSYAHKRVSDRSLQANLFLVMSPPSTADGFYYAPAMGTAAVSWPNGVACNITFRRGGAWGEEAALHVVLRQRDASGRWNLYGYSDRVSAVPEGEAQLTGYIEVWPVRPRLVGELSTRLHAEFSQGASRTRVIGVESPPSWGMALVIEEHDSELVAVDGRQFENMGPLMNSPVRRDVFVLVNRAAQRAEIIRSDELGSVSMNSQVVGFRRLYLPIAAGDGEWRRDGVVVKVRLERANRSLVRAFETRAPVITTER